MPSKRPLLLIELIRKTDTKKLHFDHDLRFSKGGTSISVENVRLKCRVSIRPHPNRAATTKTISNAITTHVKTVGRRYRNKAAPEARNNSAWCNKAPEPSARTTSSTPRPVALDCRRRYAVSNHNYNVIRPPSEHRRVHKIGHYPIAVKGKCGIVRRLKLNNSILWGKGGTGSIKFCRLPLCVMSLGHQLMLVDFKT